MGICVISHPLEAKKLGFVINSQRKDPSLSVASYPKFYPHITLASLPQSLETELDKIAGSIPTFDAHAPLRCYFDQVKIGDHYFRSVYVAIKPTREILSLYEEVHQRLGLEPRCPAFPHMSLCYIDDADAINGERDRFYDELRTSAVIGFKTEEPEAVQLNCGSEGTNNWVDNFKAHEVWAVRCEGPVESWEVLHKIPLN
ncbi:2',3'-cyclic-nucleotide 3'-phosphodiesterase [Psilocybe cubensis]|uniref:2',3'-cyclic-nucleotide 3'-phosphodiesterase n=1 Tax=Psilocybe cubensis TaxID=181762 RepID=A0ACB8H7X4_PSICU|nr:2',3'-cyclic-nucleotide 3'-phosphodiesterase [Psilocybe cubensis]KAH9483939.1 2',3'-cyclic-nucleotide 3'-phosphodiesterase [Psilocybe cubensis]